MVSLTWLQGLLARRRTRIVGTAAGVAVAVALLASIGTFLSSTTSKMTQRASARVPVDWQVEAATGASPAHDPRMPAAESGGCALTHAPSSTSTSTLRPQRRSML